MTIDAGRREVRVDDAPVEFTTKEFDLLRFLAERPGLALSRQQILDGVWGYDWFGDAAHRRRAHRAGAQEARRRRRRSRPCAASATGSRPRRAARHS